MKEEIEKYNYIHALRGFAILLVIFSHTGNIFPVSGWFWSLMGQGARGVQLFYIASALTLFLSLASRGSASGERRLFFYIRRFARIAPLYFLAILFYGVIGLYIQNDIGNVGIFSFSNILSHVFFIHGFSPYTINTLVPGGWSIAIEVSFYLFVPLLYFWYTKAKYKLRFLYSLILGSVFFAILFRYVLYTHPLIDIQTVQGFSIWDAFLFFAFPTQLPVFLIGVLVFHHIQNKKEYTALNVVKEVLVILGLFCFSFLVKRYTSVPVLPSYFFYSCVFGYGTLVLERYKESGKIWYKAIVNSLSEYIGVISYSLYLTHFAVVLFLRHIDIASYVKKLNVPILLAFSLCFFVLTVISILISSFTYKYIELPGVALGKRYISKLKKI